MTDATDELARLRAAVAALRVYHDAPHFEIEADEGDGERVEVIVRPADRARAEAALAALTGLAPGATEGAPAPGAVGRRIVERADAQLDRLDAVAVADAADLRLVAQETGWVMAVKHLAKQNGLTRAGQVEAEKLLAASREWVADLAGEEPGRGR